MSVAKWEHWSEVNQEEWPWFHFSARELACTHCGKLVLDTNAMDRLQAVRLIYGRPIYVASAYRCPNHPIEAAKDQPGAHSRGAAFDPYPGNGGDLAEMEDAFFQVGVLGRGKGLRDGSMHLHFDWDTTLGKRSWGY